MNFSFVSSKQVIAKIYSDLNLSEDGRIGDMQEWIGECMETIDCTKQYSQRHCTLQIHGHRALLPCGFRYIIQVANCSGQALHVGLNTTHDHYPELDKAWGHHASPTVPLSNLTYTINPPCIITSIREGEVSLYYAAFETDEDGFVMIPDNMLFKEACLWYVTAKLRFGQYSSGVLSFNEYKAVKQEADVYMDRAAAALTMPIPDEVESIGRLMQRLVVDRTSQDNLYIRDADRQFTRL
jgi:hypothetical protein